MSQPRFVGRWVRSYEESADAAQVYRPADYPFPPARGRAAIELWQDGTFVDARIGPIEGSPPEVLHWTSDDDIRGVVVCADREPITFQFEDLPNGSQRLLVYRE